MQPCILPIQIWKFEVVNAAGFRWWRKVFCLALMWKIAEERVVFTALTKMCSGSLTVDLAFVSDNNEEKHLIIHIRRRVWVVTVGGG